MVAPRAALLALPVLLSCGSPTDSGDEAVAARGTTAPFDSTAGPQPAAPAPTVPGDCEALAASPREEDAALVVPLCPASVATMDVQGLRALLLGVATRTEAAALVPHLGNAPDLQGIARLLADDPGLEPLPKRAPDPRRTQVTPITDTVLAAARHARTTLLRERDHGARTRAHAFLHRLHTQALQQLGFGDPKRLPPAARLLMADALHHGRMFCSNYWQQRVTGLGRAFGAAEVQLYRHALALDLTPHAGDPGRLARERDRVARYLTRDDVKKRVTAKLPEGHRTLLPLANEIDRLLDQGFIDRAIERGLYLGAAPGSYGIGPVADLLDSRLEAKGLTHHRPRLQRALKTFRARKPPPVERGPRPLAHRVDVPWPLPHEVIDALTPDLEALAGASGFRRRVLLGRIVLALRARPDAARVLAERGTVEPNPPGLDGLLVQLVAADHGDAAVRLPVLAPMLPPGDEAVRLAAAAQRPG